MSNPNLFFSTPVWVSTINNYKETNEKIYHYIKNLHSTDNKGIIKSNVQGWHSNNFNLEDENVIEFINLISPNINNVLNDMNWDMSKQRAKISAMWAIINKPNDFNVIHTHPNSFLSAAYYVKAPKDAGKFVFENPNTVATHSYPAPERKTEFNVKTAGLEIEEGDLLLFPAYLPHKVNENKSSEDRIVISFNVNINYFDLDKN